MHFFHVGLFGSNHALSDSMRLVSAFAVERELQESRRKELENSDANRNETTRRERRNIGSSERSR